MIAVQGIYCFCRMYVVMFLAVVVLAVIVFVVFVSFVAAVIFLSRPSGQVFIAANKVKHNIEPQDIITYRYIAKTSTGIPTSACIICKRLDKIIVS